MLSAGLAARVAAEIGDHFEQFESPNPLPCCAGQAPVTRGSGKSAFVVAHRLVGNRPLSNAVQRWASCSLNRSGWARELHDAKVARGLGHHAALRGLGNRWLEVLWHCLQKGVAHGEAAQIASRHRALGQAAQDRTNVRS